MSIQYKIYADNRVEGYWFQSLSKALACASIVKIGSRGSNPRLVDDLIQYDRPDIILMADNKPVLVLEKTREVPTGHNVGQRIGRIVRSAELGVPAIYFCPFDAMKHGNYAAPCNLNARMLEAFEKMSTFHHVPILAINWKVDKNYELIDDGSENKQIARVINDYLNSNFNHECPEILSLRDELRQEYRARVNIYPEYRNPPPSIKIVSTASFVQRQNRVVHGSAQQYLMQRERTLVYKIEMKPESCRREDPYTGMQFIYDYIWCRNGPDVVDKHTNLILYFPRLSKAIWNRNNPNDPSRKSCLWYATANAFLFSDGMEILR